MNIHQQLFGKTGLNVSVLGFGAAPAAFLKTDEQKTAGMLNEMLDAGVNVLDTAAMYPGSEQFIGKHLAGRRKDYHLISKCGPPVEGIDAPEWSAPLIAQTVDRALRLLKTDHIDVMLLHTCDLETLKKGEAMAALLAARDAGKVKFAGYSGDNEAAAYAAALPEVTAIETSINIADQVNIDKVLPVARQHGVGVIAKRPIANAAWKDPSQQPGMYQSYSETYHQRLKKMNLKPTDVGFASDNSNAWAEMALRFCISQDGVSTAVIGTTNPDNARANLRYAHSGPLPESAVRAIRDAFKKADPAGEWAGQT